jgi:hypothetical protein
VTDDALAREAEIVLGAEVTLVTPLAHSRRMTSTRSVDRVETPHGRAVVKVIAPDLLAVDAPDNAYFALREPALYDRGLPAPYVDAGIAMPELLGRFERGTDIALWLEDARGASGGALTARSFERVARRLGRAHGTADEPTSDVPWSRNFLPTYLTIWDDVGWDRIYDDDAWQQPLIRDHYPSDLRVELVRLCEQRHEILGWAERLPQTICHHDVWINNVFDRDDGTTLIDWAFSGYRALGNDVGNLITDSCGDLLLPTTLLPELDAAATKGYVAGLRDAGWRGDPAEARLGICLMVAKWSWLTPHMLRLASQDEIRVYGNTETETNHLFAERAAMLRFFTLLADEAHTLATQLGV